jgi:NAD(P)-dependent dehydrogenase (short-subunit alcohol dehydrogenase family)
MNTSLARRTRGAWSAQQIPDLTGRIAVVTGATSGIGWDTALELSRHGAQTVLACRDAGKSQAAIDRLRAAAPDARVEVIPLDLTSLASVRDFAAHFTARFSQLDLLVNNAGVMAIPRRTTADGFEMQLGTNHLGHFALTGLLLEHLLRSESGRVVTVSSLGHWAGRMRFDDLQQEHGYGRMKAYFQSKLANVLFMQELQRRADAAGLPLLSVGAHPGLSSTNLGSKIVSSSTAWDAAVAGFNGLFAQSSAAGALPSLRAATARDVRGGDYFGPRIFGIWGSPTRAHLSPFGRNAELARGLWEKSSELTGVSYAFSKPVRAPRTETA